MKGLRSRLVALLSLAILACGGARAASPIDFTDAWYVGSESGWGFSVQQQADVLYIVLTVYGSGGDPTWFAAAASRQLAVPAGHTVFAGDLSATDGPYHGGTWNPAAMASRRVGTLTFDATAIDRATLTYTVDGAQVAKSVTRLAWATENLEGVYWAGWNVDCAVVWGLAADSPISMQIQQGASNTVSIRLRNTDTPYVGVSLSGVYSQSGHLGSIVTQVQPPDSGSIQLLDIEKSSTGITARIVGTITSANGSCQIANGRIGGVLLP